MHSRVVLAGAVTDEVDSRNDEAAVVNITNVVGRRRRRRCRCRAIVGGHGGCWSGEGCSGEVVGQSRRCDFERWI